MPFADLVQRAVDRAQRRALSLHFDVSLQPGQVRAQPALLERAVMNVLDNAAKWSPTGGRVGVTLVSDGAWHLTVTDEGPGVAPEDLPHIFERFYRAQSARSMPGSGLGLAIVQRVVASHGGTVEVSSPTGGGTRVDIELPHRARAGRPEQRLPVAPARCPRGQGARWPRPRSARSEGVSKSAKTWSAFPAGHVVPVHQDDPGAAQQRLHGPLARLHEHGGGEEILVRPAGAQGLGTAADHRDHR